MNTIEVNGKDLEETAQRIYEDARKRVSGRPAWFDLNTNDPYDNVMKQRAYDLACEELSNRT